MRAWTKPVTPILIQGTWIWWKGSTTNLTFTVSTPPTAVRRVDGRGWV